MKKAPIKTVTEKYLRPFGKVWVTLECGHNHTIFDCFDLRKAPKRIRCHKCIQLPDHYIDRIRNKFADIAKMADTAMQFRSGEDFKSVARGLAAEAASIENMCDAGAQA